MADKITIGLTSENKVTIQQIIDKGYFRDQMDAAKFAMSLAILHGQDVNYTGTYDTTWNIGSFDSDSKLRTLMSILEPNNDEPYRRIEMLVNTGVHMIAEHIENNNELFLDELLNVES